MAMLDSNHSNSSSNYHRKTSTESSRRSNTQASAYAVDANTMALTGFHFSTPSREGAGWYVYIAQMVGRMSAGRYADVEITGGFEAPPSPPPSPGAAPVGSRSSLRTPQYHITEECERLFCETLKTVFLVEKDTGLENSLVMDLRNTTTTASQPIPKPPSQGTHFKHGQPTPSTSPDGHVFQQAGGLIRDYVEVWDYVAGARFRGFVAEKDDVRSMFIFFDPEVMGTDLKPGLMSLLELASSDYFSCDELIIGVDRTSSDAEVAKSVNRSLAWVGFELTLLEHLAGADGCLSDRYIFLSMDV